MTTFIVTFIALLIIIVAMSVGVLLGRSPIKGSCGGVGAALKDPNYVCDACGGNPDKCVQEPEVKAKVCSRELAYDGSSEAGKS